MMAFERVCFVMVITGLIVLVVASVAFLSL
jgi:hypothetical protein